MSTLEGEKTGSRHWLGLVARGFRGSEADPTTGPVGEAILLLAVPMVLEMVMESVFAVVDIFFVSRLGAEAVAGVALTEAILTLIYTLAMGLSIGVTALVARRIGEKDRDAASEATGQAILLGTLLALALAAPGVIWAPDILRLLGGDAATVEAGTAYARIMIGGNVVIILLFLLNAAFRGAGDATIAMRVLWLANGINIVLDPCFIFGLGPFPEMGVAGAAVATTIGRGVAVTAQVLTLLGPAGRLRVRRAHLRVRTLVMARLVRLSTSATFQVFVGTASWIGLVRILATFGPEALAGYTIAFRIVIFALLPAWGLANAAATMVGQALGARDPERAERAVQLAARMNVALLGAVGVVFMLTAPALIGLFGGDALTADFAIRCLRIVSAGFVFYAWGMVVTQSFNGAGDTWTPTLLSLACFWLWEIPLAFLLAHHFGLGPDGVFASIAIAYATLAVWAALLFRRGRWKLITV